MVTYPHKKVKESFFVHQNKSFQNTTLWLVVTAMLTAINVALSSFGLPVPGGHLYLNDIVICTAALLLDPFAAFVVGGVGSFLGDLLFYPAPMFVSLATHGLQAVVISLIANRTL
ncbi:MAG: ECF transporter S component, partial [Oscillospiraceae bacterium]|nr:ECF transporter S component [Oscillospiraceae bacterium]